MYCLLLLLLSVLCIYSFILAFWFYNNSFKTNLCWCLCWWLCLLCGVLLHKTSLTKPLSWHVQMFYFHLNHDTCAWQKPGLESLLNSIILGLYFSQSSLTLSVWEPQLACKHWIAWINGNKARTLFRSLLSGFGDSNVSKPLPGRKSDRSNLEKTSTICFIITPCGYGMASFFNDSDSNGINNYQSIYLQSVSISVIN